MMTYSTVADIWRPGERTHALLYNISLIFGGSVLLALSAQLAIGRPVPFTMQEFAVLMIGALFGSRLASMTVGLYLLEGFAGLPVFAHHLGDNHTCDACWQCPDIYLRTHPAQFPFWISRSSCHRIISFCSRCRDKNPGGSRVASLRLETASAMRAP
ncbi:MAG: biotin transporter BioY [Sedimentisphaerales bacterium]